MRRSLVIAAAVFVACKGKDAPPPPPAKLDASVSVVPSTTATTTTTPVRDPSQRIEQLVLGSMAFGCARYSNGEVGCAGHNQLGQLGKGERTKFKTEPLYEPKVKVAGLRDAIGLSAGTHHACALIKDGTVSCWGRERRASSATERRRCRRPRSR
jgi:alpha-tubulin suppressor-like RCC1 family protein